MSVLRTLLPARLCARLTGTSLLVLGTLLPTAGHAAPGVSRILDQSDEDRIVLVNVEIEPEPVEPPALAATTVAPGPPAAAGPRAALRVRVIRMGASMPDTRKTISNA
jgi:hypothetical protein